MVSIATTAPDAGSQRRPRVRGHLRGNGNFPRYGGSNGPLPPHCVAEPPASRGWERSEGPSPWAEGSGGRSRDSGPKSQEEARAWPVGLPALQNLSSPDSEPSFSFRLPRGSTPGDRAAAWARSWLCRKQIMTRFSRSPGPGPRAVASATLSGPWHQLPASQPEATAAQHPAPFKVAPKRRRPNRSGWWARVQGAAKLEDDCFSNCERTKY